MKYYLYDDQGYFITVVERREQPENSTAIEPPTPKYKLQFDGKKWVEERPDPHNGKAWNPETKEWDLEPNEPEHDLAQRVETLEEAIEIIRGGLTDG